MKPKKKRLTEEELKRWWPFDRLDPDLMPLPPKKEKPQPQPNPDWEEALL